MNIRKAVLPWAAIVSVVTAGLLLSGCSGDDSKSESSASPATTTADDATATATDDAADPDATASGDPAEDEEDPQAPTPTVDPVANPAPVPDGAEVAEWGSTIDCSGKDIVITEGGQQITLTGTCTSVTVNASMIDLVGEGTASLTVAGDMSTVTFQTVTGTVRVTGAANVVTAPEAAERVDEGTDNQLY